MVTKLFKTAVEKAKLVCKLCKHVTDLCRYVYYCLFVHWLREDTHKKSVFLYLQREDIVGSLLHSVKDSVKDDSLHQT